jgi:hypothetical protein
MIRRLRDAITGVSFNRGLALGAMVGAAIAGSTIWSRFRDRKRLAPAAPAGSSDD